MVWVMIDIYVNTMKYPLTNLEEKVHSLESSSYGDRQ